ncbi:hypothetical protein RB195_017344 [Necator americanus]
MSQPQGYPGAVYGGAGLSTSQGINPMASDLAPQFAQFGSPYQNYGSQSLSMEPTSILGGSRNVFESHPLLLPSQNRPLRQFTSQPGVFGVQTPVQSSYGQTGLAASAFDAFSPFQADDYTGSVQKPGSIPPSEPIRVIPPFLKDRKKEDQDKFYAIVQHPTWSASEKTAKIDELIQTLDEDVQNIYGRYQRAMNGDLTAKRQKVHESVAEMSPEAQQQFQKVSALMTNPQIPEQERLQKIQDLYAKIPDTIKQEFDSKFIGL